MTKKIPIPQNSTAWHVTAQALVDLFYPLLEATLINLRDNSIIVSINSFDSSNKKLSNAETIPNYTRPVITSLKGGRKVKTTDIAIRNEEGIPEMVLRLRFDITIFEAIQGQIATLLAAEETASSPQDRWQTQIDLTIKSYLKTRKLTMAAASRSHKREIVMELFQKGLFDYKDASSYIADVLETSRATVYNYLNWATTVRRVSIHQVDAFTDKRFGGNPAGVVLDAEVLTDELMRKITREMNLSETAFVLPSGNADLRLRYFTPSGDEVKFCGHSTVGALYMLAREGRHNITAPGKYTPSVETLCGVIKAYISINDVDNITVGYEAPYIDLSDAAFSPLTVCDALGINPSIVDTTLAMGIEDTNRTLFVPIKTLKALGEITCDLRKTAEFSKQNDLVTICLLTTECFDSTNHAHCRVFAPAVGIPEDPFTGSIQGGLAAYLHQHKLVKNSLTHIRAEQGHFMERPGTVRISLQKKNGQYHAIIEAQAVHLFSTQIDLL